MNVNVYFKKATFELINNVNKIFPVIRRNFSIINTLWNKKSPPTVTLIQSKNCDPPSPIFKTNCRVALVLGGTNHGYGFYAADQLLLHGVKRIILADNNEEIGICAAEKLCKAHGKERAKFYFCDLKNSCHIEGIFTSSYCRDDKVSILFNDIDAIQNLSESRLNYCKDVPKMNNTRRILNIAFQCMSCKKIEGKELEPRDIIINCASILGFIGWPTELEPIYCGSEPTIETTLSFSKSHPVKDTGLRVVSLCPTNQPFKSITLPEFPNKSIVKPWSKQHRPCVPDPIKDKNRLGKALVHVMGYGETGSIWLIEPPFALHELPRLIKFPEPNRKK